MLSKDGEIFYPHGVNVGFLMNPALPDDEVSDTIAGLAKAGVNTLRLGIDDAHAPDAALKTYQEKNGRLKEPVLSRLDTLFDAAERHDMFIILSIFDLQTIGERWKDSPYNRANGGACEKLDDFFTSSNQLMRSMERVAQLVSRYKTRNLLAWELARGANLWELNWRPNYTLMKGVALWTVRMANTIRKEAPDNPIAISILPNTFPESLFNLPQIDLYFINVIANDAIDTANSIPSYIRAIHKQFKKPVFVVESRWNGEPHEREMFTRNLFWSSFASMSASFLMPQTSSSRERIPDSDLNLIKTLQFVMPGLDLSGVPREITVPQKTIPGDTYLIVESLTGYDRIYWILRKQPGKSQAQLEASTIEGVYEKQWFDIEKIKKYPRGKFSLRSKRLLQESPPFERDVLGVLKLVKRVPEMKKMSDSAPSPDKK